MEIVRLKELSDLYRRYEVVLDKIEFLNQFTIPVSTTKKVCGIFHKTEIKIPKMEITWYDTYTKIGESSVGSVELFNDNELLLRMIKALEVEKSEIETKVSELNG